jgi:hypothetical protein
LITKILLTVFYFAGPFLPSWIRIRITNPDPDPQHCMRQSGIYLNVVVAITTVFKCLLRRFYFHTYCTVLYTYSIKVCFLQEELLPAHLFIYPARSRGPFGSTEAMASLPIPHFSGITQSHFIRRFHGNFFTTGTLLF